MKYKYFLSISLFSTLLLTSCGGSSEIDTPRESTKPVIEAKIDAFKSDKTEFSAEDALLKRGRIIWFKCRSCHELSADGPHKVGPNLNALMGAKIGAKEGFVYSKVMASSDIIWDEETLDAFIKKPSAYIKGTKMAFVGIQKESDRQALIKYIKENSK